MGSSTSKRREKRKKPQHLPKVGTKPNRDYELREKRRLDFGGLGIVLVAVLVGLLIVATIAVT